jgi:hypothetical protein
LRIGDKIALKNEAPKSYLESRHIDARPIRQNRNPCRLQQSFGFAGLCPVKLVPLPRAADDKMPAIAGRSSQQVCRQSPVIVRLFDQYAPVPIGVDDCGKRRAFARTNIPFSNFTHNSNDCLHGIVR